MATVTVVGRGEASAPPDQGSLALTVDALRASSSEALAEVAQRTAALLTLLDDLSVGPVSRQTSGVQVSEEGEHRDGTWQLRGYRASERVAVRVADTATIGRLLAEAVDRVGAKADGPWWSVSAGHPVRAQALDAAAADARVRAEALVLALGGRLGALVEAVESGAQRPEPRMHAMRMGAADTVPIEAGETTVTASVSVTYQVESA